MTIVANPIYDVVFKFLMEDKKVATILLSALLKKDVINLEYSNKEIVSKFKDKLSLFRIDFSATLREKDGSEHLVLIELQKTWRPNDTFRFRKYLGLQYFDENNMISLEKGNRILDYGIPMISIYILGHGIGGITEPVIYVRRNYFDYDNNILPQKNEFIESLTHDSIIIQVPFLKNKTRNRLERLLQIFNQDMRDKQDDHLMELDEKKLSKEKGMSEVLRRLRMAATATDIRDVMCVEDEILSDYEKVSSDFKRLGNKMKEAMKEKDSALREAMKEKDSELKEKNSELKESKNELEQTKKQQEIMLRNMVSILYNSGATKEDIAMKLSITLEDVNRFIK